MNCKVSLILSSSAGFVSMEALRQSLRKASKFSIHNLISYVTSIHPRGGFVFGHGAGGCWVESVLLGSYSRIEESPHELGNLIEIIEM